MNTQERLLQAHSFVSKASGSLAVIILILSAYIAQRSLAVIGMSPDLLDTLVSPRLQFSLVGLGFSYRTMTMVWPGVLGILCIAFSVLQAKRKGIEKSFESGQPVNAPGLVELDPLHFTSTILDHGAARLAAKIIAWLPMVGIVLHIWVLLTWIGVLGLRARRISYIVEAGPLAWSAGAVFSASSLLFVVLGFCGAATFRNSIRRRINVGTIIASR